MTLISQPGDESHNSSAVPLRFLSLGQALCRYLHCLRISCFYLGKPPSYSTRKHSVRQATPRRVHKSSKSGSHHPPALSILPICYYSSSQYWVISIISYCYRYTTLLIVCQEFHPKILFCAFRTKSFDFSLYL